MDFNELADRYVSVWNEKDTERRRQLIKELWREDGIECTKLRETVGHVELEKRIIGSHEKNVRDGSCIFRSCQNADGHHNMAKFDWEMIKLATNAVVATGCYILYLDDTGKIRAAYLFVES